MPEKSGDIAFATLCDRLMECAELHIDLDLYSPGFLSGLLQQLAHSGPSQLLQAMGLFALDDVTGIKSIEALAESDLLIELGAKAVKCSDSTDGDDQDDAKCVFDPDSCNIDVDKALGFVEFLAEAMLSRKVVFRLLRNSAFLSPKSLYVATPMTTLKT